MQVVMLHYWHKDAQGNIHVQNTVGGMLGQHHVHTPKSFENWRLMTPASSLRELKYTQQPCTCGLKPGQVRDHRGNVTTMKGKD
jgi:hypothetical protein